MPDISTPKATAEIISKYNFNFRKDYGQNFLIDSNILSKIVDCAGVTGEDTVLEIGPGIGSMTACLCRAASHVIAVEIDEALIPILNETLSEYNNVTVLNRDILKTDIKALSEEYAGGKPLKVVANLPYYITTPIIVGLLEGDAPIDSITVMVQKEVADRMQVGPGTKEYGALSLAVQYYSNPKIMVNVPPECFMPRPKVGSAVIRLDLYDTPPIKTRDKDLMFKIIRAAFNQRRKTLTNALANSQNLNLTKEEAIEAVSRAGLAPNIRGEALRLEEFALLTDCIRKD